jgi:predicted ATPase
LGYPDQALQRSREALALAQELAHPFSLAFALNWAATVHQFRREWRATQERSEELIALSTEQGFALWVLFATVLHGWALAEQGQQEEGMAQMRRGANAWRATGAEVDRSYFLALLAEAHGHAGQVEDGLALLAEALAVVDRNRDRYWDAELHRLKGELLLQQAAGMGASRIAPVEEDPLNQGEAPRAGSGLDRAGPAATIEAESCFRQALEVAHRQSAKSLELRAVMSLSRLLQKQGKKEEAQRMLAEIYGWFTEGFDTRDLKEAKALLEEVS